MAYYGLNMAFCGINLFHRGGQKATLAKRACFCTTTLSFRTNKPDQNPPQPFNLMFGQGKNKYKIILTRVLNLYYCTLRLT